MVTTMKRHELKIQPADFEAVLTGVMTHQARNNDRGFAVGDVLVLKEWRPSIRTDNCYWNITGQPGTFTGRVVEARVTHLTFGEYNLPRGLAIMSIRIDPPREVGALHHRDFDPDT